MNTAEANPVPLVEGWFDPPEPLCEAVIVVTIADRPYELRCEEDADHEPPHAGTVRWDNPT